MSLKQVILVRQDLNLPKGKLAAQVAHASISAYDNANFIKKNNWKHTGMKKIVLKVQNLEELKDYYKKAKQAKLPCSIISDAGHTVVEAGTVTCVGIGPETEEKIDIITGELKML
jgi:peptidyl-tRNA hydrolase, PTH2 family